jgi:hypothetical protein
MWSEALWFLASFFPMVYFSVLCARGVFASKAKLVELKLINPMNPMNPMNPTFTRAVCVVGLVACTVAWIAALVRFVGILAVPVRN